MRIAYAQCQRERNTQQGDNLPKPEAKGSKSSNLSSYAFSGLTESARSRGEGFLNGFWMLDKD
jgi:hypothetical protein